MILLKLASNFRIRSVNVFYHLLHLTHNTTIAKQYCLINWNIWTRLPINEKKLPINYSELTFSRLILILNLINCFYFASFNAPYVGHKDDESLWSSTSTRQFTVVVHSITDLHAAGFAFTCRTYSSFIISCLDFHVLHFYALLVGPSFSRLAVSKPYVDYWFVGKFLADVSWMPAEVNET